MRKEMRMRSWAPWFKRRVWDRKFPKVMFFPTGLDDQTMNVALKAVKTNAYAINRLICGIP